VENPSRVHFSLPTAAGRSVGGEDLVFSYEEIRNGLVKRVGSAMVLCSGMGGLRLGFDVPDTGPLAADQGFRTFVRKLIRSIPSPFYFLTLESDSLKLLFLCTLENLEIKWRAGDTHSHISADSEEYSALFTEEASRLKAVLSANGGMGALDERIKEIGEYFAE
jgi:hypothetical protein